MKYYFSVIFLLSGVVGSLRGAEEGCAFSLKQSESHESSESEIRKLFAQQLPFNGEDEIVDCKVVSCTISTQTGSSEIKKLLLTSIDQVGRNNIVRSNLKVGEHFEQASPEELIVLLTNTLIERDKDTKRLDEAYETAHIDFVNEQKKVIGLKIQVAHEKEEIKIIQRSQSVREWKALFVGFITTFFFKMAINCGHQEGEKD